MARSYIFKWKSSQAELSSWAQPLKGWKTFLNTMKQTLAGSGMWFLCMKWTVQEKKYSPFVVFFTTPGFSFCDCIFLPLLDLLEININLLITWREKQLCCWDERLQRYKRTRTYDVFLRKTRPSHTHDSLSSDKNSHLPEKGHMSSPPCCPESDSALHQGAQSQ